MPTLKRWAILKRPFEAVLLILCLFVPHLQAAAQVSALRYDATGNLSNVVQVPGTASSISVQPVDQLISANGTVSFSVSASGLGPLSYQWLSNGVAISGATGDVLTVSGITLPTNLVVNGGFESPPLVYAASQIYAAGQNLSGWFVDSGSVALVRSAWEPDEGVQSLELNGSATGSIAQDLVTVPGQSYYLHFALAGPPGSPVLRTNQVWWDGSLLDTLIFDTTGHTLSSMGWTNRSYLVTATTTTTHLRFVSLTAGANGPALDAVSVFPAPPAPAAYSVIVSNASGTITSTGASIQFDLDNNTLPDAWELAHFGATGQDPAADSDGDGVSNLSEYLEGTDPLNPASFRPRLNLLANAGGSFSLSPLQPSYALNQSVQVTAVPDSGYVFLNWTGGITDTNPTLNLVMDGHKTLNAVFAQVLNNCQSFTGVLGPVGTNIYTFYANTGDSFILQIGTAATTTAPFYPQVLLTGPNGFAMGDAGDPSGTYLVGRLTNGGQFVVYASSYYPAGSGSYHLNLAKSPGGFAVSPGDEGGPLTNGAVYTGTIPVGDLDMWSFAANAGDTITLQAGALIRSNNNFYPQLFLYGPDGALLSRVNDPAGAYLTTRATNSGTFTAVLNSYYNSGAGSYWLNLAKSPGAFVVSPGDEGGPLTNGAVYLGALPTGDLDLWSFTANAGDSILLQVGAIVRSNAQFYPQISLYGPDGALLSRDNDPSGVYLLTRATNSGTFNVVVNSYYDNGAGTYWLNLAKAPGAFVVSPGDEGGPLTNGVTYNGLLPVGDLDLWSFSANSGDNLTLRMGATVRSNAQFYPQIFLFGPDGALLSRGNSPTDTYLNTRATNSGTFTVVVNSYYDNGAGAYQLNLAKAPGAFTIAAGDEGGALTNGGNHDGVTLLGDEDMWSFTANKGDNVVLRCGQISGDANYSPWLRLYGPDGTALANVANASDSYLAYQTTTNGTFTVLVGSYYGGNTGTYRLRLMQMPGTFLVPPGDEGGPIASATVYAGTNDLGDEDPWTFTAFKGAPIHLECQKTGGTASYQPWLRLYGPAGAYLASANSSTTASLNYTPTNTGVFTVLVGSYYAGNTGGYRLSGTGLSTGLNLQAPTLAGTNLLFTGAGGASNAQFIILTTTNITTPLALWTPAWTNRFDATGAFSYTNLLTPGQAQQFFRLLAP